MASTQPVRLPERNPPEPPELAPSGRTVPAPRKVRFTIKVKGMIPT